MTVDEEFFARAEKSRKSLASGIIMPDGSYELTIAGHLAMLLGLMPMPKEKVWEQIPKNDSPLFWLIEHTGCVITDENATVGLKMTAAQQQTYRALVEHGVIADKYFDLTRERLRAAGLADSPQKHDNK